MKLKDILSEKDTKMTYDHYGRPNWTDDWMEEIDYHDMDNPMPNTIVSPENAALWDKYSDVTWDYDEPPEKKYISNITLPITDIISIEVKLDPRHMEALERDGITSKAPITVSKLDGKYLCVDGNHRLAYMLAHGGGNVKVKLQDYDKVIEDDMADDDI